MVGGMIAAISIILHALAAVIFGTAVALGMNEERKRSNHLCALALILFGIAAILQVAQ